jgi:hypothetical protein
MTTIDEPYIQHQERTVLPPNFMPMNSEIFDPEVWGPHYWFFIHTLSHTYPETPNAVTKRKYYDFISNLPLFIPNPEIGNKFAVFLDKYPVSPYLDSRDSFIRWVHFAHNRINIELGKEEITLFKGLDSYYVHYKPKKVKISERFHIKREYVYFVFIFLLLFAVFLFGKYNSSI